MEAHLQMEAGTGDGASQGLVDYLDTLCETLENRAASSGRKGATLGIDHIDDNEAIDDDDDDDMAGDDETGKGCVGSRERKTCFARTQNTEGRFVLIDLVCWARQRVLWCA